VNYKTLITTILFLISQDSFTQDTIKIDKSQFYSTQEVQKLSGKGFSGNYGQENVIFSKFHTKVEQCYYTESIRTCYGFHYRIINDSILVVGDSLTNNLLESWIFRKLESNRYYVFRISDGFLESGEVDTLIPLKQIAPFITTTLDKKDTLWSSDDFTCMNRKYGYYYANFDVNTISGEVYDYDEIDSPPSFLSGDSISPIAIESIQPCISEPMTWLSTVTCVITKDGRILNTEQALGGISDYCSFTIMEINKIISSWGKVKPATLNGVPVNVRWFIKINDLSQPLVHPAFADTDENRKAYLKKKKRLANKN
jgi:hypothetical protein